MHDDCIKKEQWGELKEKLKQYDKHLDDADCKGGFRDRVGSLERGMQLVPYICAACSFFGGLLGKAAPDALNNLIGLFR